MQTLITGIFGLGVFLLFVGGLAHSIGQVPFIIIVAIVGAMALFEFYETYKKEKADKDKK